MQKFAGQVRKGNVIVIEGREFKVTKVEPVMGGSWFNYAVKSPGTGQTGVATYGHSEKVEVKA